ncbi:Uncharacterized protein Rs2_09117 [Raphanus sativus]|nr:Uncharacterized protein Rs2_09117 [Raphanus sativus]
MLSPLSQKLQDRNGKLKLSARVSWLLLFISKPSNVQSPGAGLVDIAPTQSSNGALPDGLTKPPLSPFISAAGVLIAAIISAHCEKRKLLILAKKLVCTSSQYKEEKTTDECLPPLLCSRT